MYLFYTISLREYKALRLSSSRSTLLIKLEYVYVLIFVLFFLFIDKIISKPIGPIKYMYCSVRGEKALSVLVGWWAAQSQSLKVCWTVLDWAASPC